MVERNLLDAQVVVGGDLLGHHEVVLGLRIARVGDGCGADFKVALGRCQLFGHRRLLRLDEGQVVLRRQHIEVGLADAHDQVLVGAGQLGLGQVHLLDALLVAGPVGGTVQRLRCAQRAVLRAIGAVERRGRVRRVTLAGTGIAGRQIGGRQNRRHGLVGLGQRCVVL